jgi:hypothetical protein
MTETTADEQDLMQARRLAAEKQATALVQAQADDWKNKAEDRTPRPMETAVQRGIWTKIRQLFFN